VKGLYLAGEYLYMPSVDGALRSGIDAAEAALRG
jgi:predicted NAD/FAD-dependent oxidoreductase